MGLVGGQVAELVVLIVCILLFILYHVWYFLLPSLNLQLFPRHISLWTTSVKTRSLWCEIMMQDPKEGINSVQTVRNMIISVSLLAAAEATLIGTMLNILTDPTRLAQVEIFSKSDPISGGVPLLSPEVKVALALAALFLSLLTFAQCVRIAVHLGFLIRVIPSHPHISLPLRDETIILMQRASLYFTVGLRLLYSFVPLVFYMGLGPTSLLVSTVLLLIALLLLDTVPARQVAHLLRVSTTISDGTSYASGMQPAESFRTTGYGSSGAETPRVQQRIGGGAVGGVTGNRAAMQQQLGRLSIAESAEEGGGGGGGSPTVENKRNASGMLGIHM